MKTIRAIVKGQVQGVYFRVYVKKQAVKLGVLGFVKNTDDGSVEVIAKAEQSLLDSLISQCKKGSALSKVAEVIISEYETEESFSQFDIR